MKRPALGWSLLLHLALLAWLLLACLPIVWTAIISLRQYVDAFSVPVTNTNSGARCGSVT